MFTVRACVYIGYFYMYTVEWEILMVLKFEAQNRYFCGEVHM